MLFVYLFICMQLYVFFMFLEKSGPVPEKLLM